MAVSFNLPDPYEAQKAEIARRQKYAEALQQQAFQPIEASSYQGIQAPIPATAVLAKALQGALGGYMAGEGARQQRELRQQDVTKSQEFAQALQGAKTPEERQAIALRAMGGEFGQRAQIIGGGEYQMAEARSQKEAQRQFQAEQAELNRQARAEQAQQQMDLRRDIATGQQAIAAELGRGRLEAARDVQAQRAEAEASKLPPNVVTTYQNARSNENQAASTAQAMQQHIADIESGKLPLGAISNLAARARNIAGMSTPESVRYADMMRDVEGAVNTVLMAAKGTQTEGDARRAREQILANPNDPEVVKSALKTLVESAQKSQNIYRGTMNQLGGKYRGLEHERLPEVSTGKPASPAPTAPAPAASADINALLNRYAPR